MLSCLTLATYFHSPNIIVPHKLIFIHKFHSHFLLVEIIFVYECWSESEIIIYCKPDDFRLLGKEHSLTVINHSYEIDFIILWLLIDKFKGLGSSRGFVKNELKYVPIWGWFFGLAGHIFLQRSFEKDKKLIEDKVRDYLTNIENNWLVLLAEGTRFSLEKHAVCEKFAKERNLEPLKHHLIPRARGFAVTVPILKKHNCPTLYNVQLAFDKNAPHQATLGTLLRGQKIVAHVYIDRISMEKVEPTFEYLFDLYKEKDAMADSFHKFGNFFEGRKEEVLKGIKMEVRQTVKINSIFWIAFIFCCIMYQAIQLILAGQIMFLLGTSTAVISVCEYY